MNIKRLYIVNKYIVIKKVFSVAAIFLVAFFILSKTASAVTTIGTNISTAGNLTVDGALKFTSGANNSFILTTDASGNATWISVSGALGTVTTDNLSEGATNQYYDDAFVDARISTQKGFPNGLAPLDSTSLVPVSNLPVGTANGLATLDSGGKVPSSQIPSLVISNTYVVADQAALLGLSANIGDVAVQTDINKTFILQTTPASNLANWIQITTPAQVVSFNGRAGAIAPQAGDYVASDVGLGTGSAPVFTGLTLSGLIPGSVIFAGTGGLISQDNNLFWDSGNSRLGIKNNTPTYTLDVAGDIKAGDGSLILLGEKIDPDPSGVNGAMYYNSSTNRFRCFENSSWKDCDTTGGTTSLQSAYNSGATITTAGSIDINFTLTSGNFNVSGAHAVNLTPTEASSFTSGGALTLTGGAGSNWSTSAGALTITSAAAADWGTTVGNLNLHAAGTGAGNIQIGSGSGSATPDLLVADIKNNAGDPTGTAGAMYYSSSSGRFRCYENGSWKDCDTTGGTADLQTIYNNGATITTAASTDLALTLTSGNFTATGAGAVNLTPTSASSFISGGALTLTGGATSTWGTTIGNLTIDSGATLNLGNTNATAVSIGSSTVSTTINGPLAISRYADFAAVSAPAYQAGRIFYDSGKSNLAYYNDIDGAQMNLGKSIWAKVRNGSGALLPKGSIVYINGADAFGNTIVNLAKADNYLTSQAAGIIVSDIASGGLGYMTFSGAVYNLDTSAFTAGDSLYLSPTTAGQMTATKPSFPNYSMPLAIVAYSDPALGAIGINISPFVAGAFTAGAVTFGNTDGLTAVDSDNLFWDNTNKRLGIGDNTPAASLTVGSGDLFEVFGASGNITTQGDINLSNGGGNITATDGVLKLIGTNVQIGSGAGSATPDLLVADIKNTVGDPTGTAGATYYNSNLGKFRCFENGSWKDCDTGGANSLQSVYNTGATITTASSTDIALTLTSGNFTASGAGAVNLTPTSASSFTSGGALTLTGGATSTWGTTAGNLSLQAAGTGTTSNILIGLGGVGSVTPDLFGLDVKSDAGDPTGYNGAMYYNNNLGKFRCYENGAWMNCTSIALSQLTPALGANTINNGDNAQVWNWSLSTIDKAGLTFSENSASTATGSSLIKAATLATSAAIPLYITNLGDGPSFRVDDAGGGDTTPFFIDKDGSVAVGSTSFDATNPEKLKVEAGTTDSYNVISGYGDINSFLQLNIRNRNAGNNASSDIVATADNGDSSVNYIDMGINSSGYAGAEYTITGPNTGYLYNNGGDFSLGTQTLGKDLLFHTGGTLAENERMRIDGDGKVGIGTSTPSYLLDVAGDIKAGDGSLFFLGRKANPDPSGVNGAIYYNSTSNKLRCYENSTWKDCDTGGANSLQSVYNTGATITTASSTDIALTLTSGNFTASGAGAVNLTPTSASSFTSGGALTLTGGATSTLSTTAGALILTSATTADWGTTVGNLKLYAAGTGTGNIQVGSGVGSATPDLLVTDIKSDAGDPTGTAGAMYYNANTSRFRCFENGSWKDCDTTGGTATLQTTYNSGATITTAASTDLALTLTSGNFTASGAGAVNLTPTSASSFTSGGALTLTGGATSTWGTTAGNLSLQAAGTGTTSNILIGLGGAGSVTPDLFGLDVKSDAGDPTGYNGAMYYNNNLGKFRCYEASGWKDCDTGVAAGSLNLQQVYNNGGVITTASSSDFSLILTSGNFTATGAGAVNLTPTSASSFTSGGALTLTGGATSTWGTTVGNLNLQAAGTGTTANVQIGSGAGSVTPDLFVLDVKNTAGDPTGVEGAMYFNSDSSRFRCYQAGAWKDCDVRSAPISLQLVYDSGPTITTAASTDLALTLTSGNFTATGAGAVNLTPTSASSFTSGGALTLTGGATSTWGTTAGNLNLYAANSGTGNIQIGSGAGSATPDLLVADIKNTAGDPTGTAGAMYYNSNTNRFRCFENGAWVDCSLRSIGLAKGDLIAFTAAATPARLPIAGSDNRVLSSDATQATGMKWSSIASISADAFDFSELNDAMTLDAATSIALASNNLSITGAGALTLTPGAASTWSTSAGALTITSAAAADWGTTAGNLNLHAANSGTGNIQIGSGAGSATPDLLVADIKNTAGDPTGTAGAMYYNSNSGKLRCYENGFWKDCDTTGATTLQLAYNNGPTITTAGSTDLALTLTSGNFTATGAGAVNLTPTSASSFTSGGALTLTGGATSTWGTSVGNLNISSAGALILAGSASSTLSTTSGSLTIDPTTTLNLGTANTTGVSIGKNGSIATVNGSLAIPNYIDITTASNPAHSEGRLFYDSNSKALSYYNDQSGLEISLGRQYVLRVYNQTGSSINAGQVVYISGVFSDTPSVSLARADVEATARAMGIAPINIANNTFGYVTTRGLISSLNTAAFSNGDAVYLSATTAGALTATPPAEPNFAIPIGYVVKSDATTGIILAEIVSHTRPGSYNLGGVAFAGTNTYLTSDNTNLFWDNTNKRLGIGDNTPAASLTVGSGDLFEVFGASGNITTQGDIVLSTGGGSITATGGALNLNASASSTFYTSSGNIILQPANSATANVQIGSGAGSATPDLLVADIKNTVGDPTGTAGATYYNSNLGKFRCYENGSWKDCDTTGGTVNLQSAYNSGATITTAASTDLALTLTSGNFTATGSGAVNLTPTSASSFTSGGALTLTGGATSTLSTTAGALTLTSATAADWGTTAGNLKLRAAGALAGNIQIGNGGAGSATPDLLLLDTKSSAGDPAGTDGAMYYSIPLGEFRCYEKGVWMDCDGQSYLHSLQTAYDSGAAITTSSSTNIAFTLTSGNFTATGAGAVNLTPTSASSFTSAGALTLTGGATSTWGTTVGNLNLQVAGTGATANVQIGSGAGSATPDLLVADIKNTVGDPTGTAGAIYYNSNTNRFRCFENAVWKDCDTAGSLQTAYSGGGGITTTGSNNIAFTLTSGNFTATGAGAVNLTPTSASSFTSGGALTLTGGAASTWSTSAGALTLTGGAASTWSTSAGALSIDSAAALNLGNTNATGVSIGKTGITTTNNGALTVSQTLTASNGLTLTTGTLNLTATAGALTLSGLSASSINTGANSLTLNTVGISATALTFAGAGSISSNTTNALTLDSGTTGAINIGTNANAKTITIGNNTGATAIQLNAGTGGIILDTGSTPILQHLSATAANLVSASIGGYACANYGTITVTGAAVGDTVIASPTAVTGGIETVQLIWNVFVSAANTVTIRACNSASAAINTANTQTWRADIWKH